MTENLNKRGGDMNFTPSEKSVLKLFGKESRINYKFFAGLCWVIVWPSVFYCVTKSVDTEELHAIAHMMLMGMICSIFAVMKTVISKYDARIAELEAGKP